MTQNDTIPQEQPSATPKAPSLTKQQLWERKLLDFSLRNNLINRKLGKRVIRLATFDTDQVEDRIRQGIDFRLLPYPKPKDGQKEIDAVELHNLVASEMEQHHLLTLLDEGDLRTELKFLYRTSRTTLEESGVGALFLAIGILKWYEDDRTTTARYAPILLVPVDIVRKAGQTYVIRARDEETVINRTLVEMLRQEFKIDLTDLTTLPTEDNGTVAVKKVIERVVEATAELTRWQVQEFTELGIFYFQKVVMWNDIHTGADRLTESPVIRSLVEGRVTLDRLDETIDARAIDRTVRPDEFAIPMDVDSSQMAAVIESGRGKSFILYGPPGTGKSQTITNMIANALYHDKRVLFVAEKMAALTVVQKRLAKIGLDPFCLELHSNKVTKRHFLAQMQKALDAPHVAASPEFQATSERLFEHRQRLIHYAEALHKPQAGGLSLYDCLSHYLATGGDELTEGLPPSATVTAEGLATWIENIESLTTVFAVTGHPSEHPLRGLHPREWSLEREIDIKRGLEQVSVAMSRRHAVADLVERMATPALLAADPDALMSEWQAVDGKNFIAKLWAKGSYVKAFIGQYIKVGATGPTFDQVPSLVATLKEYHAIDSVLDDLRRVADIDLASPADDIEEASERWLAHLSALKTWCLWTERRAGLVDAGLSCVVRHLEHTDASPVAASAAMQKGIYHRLAMEMVDADADLRMFNGLIFEDIIAKYKQTTAQFQELTKHELYARLASRIPSQTIAAAANSELGILKRNIANGGRMTSIRQLLTQIPSLLPKLCPCMLMSPLSVAQFLDLDGEKFDLVIFDEASQMPTSEAIGAIARGKALICVGDPKQMPPTSFFETQSTDDEEAAIDDMESILDDCITLSMPSHYLTWHYRSKHESLIAFSNVEYYDGRLYTFPSVDDLSKKVSLVHVDGAYDKGNTRSNEAEARAIVGEVVRRLSDDVLSQRSIGIVSFSKAQQDLIEDILTEELAKRPTLEAKAYDGEEPIFVKNLENVQGDERDVILFSVGYGPDRDGNLSMNFGPLNQDGGERRLNVAVSRARYEMMVFAILRPEQIDLKRSSARGVEGLKRFLEFAGSGRLSATTAPAATSPLTSTSLNEQIATALRDRGYAVNVGVGRSEFKIDVAVIDPRQPERYLLAIMCDGKNYYTTPTVRDREICQPNVLGMLEWNVMRVWAIDWYENRDGVMERIVGRLDELLSKPVGTATAAAAPVVEKFDLDKAATTAAAAEPTDGPRPYVAAELGKAKRMPAFDETNGTVSVAVRQDIRKIVEAEQPVTAARIASLVAAHLGYPNGKRLQQFVAWQLDDYHRDPRWDGDAAVYWVDAAAATGYTSFRDLSGLTARELPLPDVANAAAYVSRTQGNMPAEALHKATLTVLGFARRGAALDAAVTQALAPSGV